MARALRVAKDIQLVLMSAGRTPLREVIGGIRGQREEVEKAFDRSWHREERVDSTGTSTGAGTFWLWAFTAFGRHRDFMQENRINKGLGH